MSREDFEELVAPERFSPFVITTTEGTPFAVGDWERSRLLVAARMVVLMDRSGNLSHIPYRSIAHIHGPKEGNSR